MSVVSPRHRLSKCSNGVQPCCHLLNGKVPTKHGGSHGPRIIRYVGVGQCGVRGCNKGQGMCVVVMAHKGAGGKAGHWGNLGRGLVVGHTVTRWQNNGRHGTNKWGMVGVGVGHVCHWGWVRSQAR